MNKQIPVRVHVCSSAQPARLAKRQARGNLSKQVVILLAEGEALAEEAERNRAVPVDLCQVHKAKQAQRCRLSPCITHLLAQVERPLEVVEGRKHKHGMSLFALFVGTSHECTQGSGSLEGNAIKR